MGARKNLHLRRLFQGLVAPQSDRDLQYLVDNPNPTYRKQWTTPEPEELPSATVPTPAQPFAENDVEPASKRRRLSAAALSASGMQQDEPKLYGNGPISDDGHGSHVEDESEDEYEPAVDQDFGIMQQDETMVSGGALGPDVSEPTLDQGLDGGFQPRFEDDFEPVSNPDQDVDFSLADQQQHGTNADGTGMHETGDDSMDLEVEEEREDDSLFMPSQPDGAAQNHGRLRADWQIDPALQAAVDAMNAQRRNEAHGGHDLPSGHLREPVIDPAPAARLVRQTQNAGSLGQHSASDRATSDEPSLKESETYDSEDDVTSGGASEEESGLDELEDYEVEEYMLRQTRNKNWRDSCSDWRADVRQVMCNILFEDPDRRWPENEILARLESEVTTVAWSYMNSLEGDFDSLRARGAAILKRSPDTFIPCGRSKRHMVDGTPQMLYRLNCGPGRLVGSEALQELFSAPSEDVEMIDCMDIPFAFFVSMTRVSGKCCCLRLSTVSWRGTKHR